MRSKLFVLTGSKRYLRWSPVMLVVVLSLAVLFGGATTSDAALVFTLQEQGSNTVLSGSGSINLTGFSQILTGLSGNAGLRPNRGLFEVGPTAYIFVYKFAPTDLTGPSSFGSGAFTNETSALGDTFGFDFSSRNVTVPAGYQFGNLLSGSAVFPGTLADLGATLGTYTWTLPDDTITLNVVPIPGAVWLLGSGLVGLIGIRRKLKK